MHFIAKQENMYLIVSVIAGDWMPSLAGERLQNLIHVKTSGAAVCLWAIPALKGGDDLCFTLSSEPMNQATLWRRQRKFGGIK